MPITINGTGSITGISAGGLPDDCITTADIAAGAVTTAKITGGPAFRAYRSTNVAVSNNNWNKFAANVESFDTNNAFDSSTNYRFTPTVAGYYQVNVAISIEGSSVTRSRCIAAIYKNGVIVSRGSDNQTSETFVSVLSDIVYLNGSTDYIEAYGYISSGGGTVVFTGGDALSYFSAFLARPA